MRLNLTCKLLALCIFILCVFLSNTLSYAEETGGWKFLKWGMSPEEVDKAAKANDMEFAYEEDEFKRMEQADLRDRKRRGVEVYYDSDVKKYVDAPGLTIIKGSIRGTNKGGAELFFFNEQLIAAYTGISFTRYLEVHSVVVETLKERYPKGKIYKQKIIPSGFVNCFKYETKSQKVFTLVVQNAYFNLGGIWYVNPGAINQLRQMVAEQVNSEAQAKRKKIKSSY